MFSPPLISVDKGLFDDPLRFAYLLRDQVEFQAHARGYFGPFAQEPATSWATPLIVEHEGKPQVVTAATSRVRSYDLASGKELWDAEGLTTNAIPSPVTAGGMAQALLTAELLAPFVTKALADGGTRGDRWLRRFDRQRRALLRDYHLLPATRADQPPR